MLMCLLDGVCVYDVLMCSLFFVLLLVFFYLCTSQSRQRRSLRWVRVLPARLELRPASVPASGAGGPSRCPAWTAMAPTHSAPPPRQATDRLSNNNIVNDFLYHRTLARGGDYRGESMWSENKTCQLERKYHTAVQRHFESSRGGGSTHQGASERLNPFRDNNEGKHRCTKKAERN